MSQIFMTRIVVSVISVTMLNHLSMDPFPIWILEIHKPACESVIINGIGDCTIKIVIISTTKSFTGPFMVKYRSGNFFTIYGLESKQLWIGI